MKSVLRFREKKTTGAHQGNIILLNGLPNTTINYILFISTILVVAYVSQYHYTRKLTVTGSVQAYAEQVRLFPLQAGILAKRFATEGEQVKAGQVLFLLDSERHSKAHGVERQVAAALDERIHLLLQDSQDQIRLGQLQTQDLQQRLKRNDEQQSSARQELAVQQRRMQLAHDMLTQQQQLAASGFVSAAQVLQKEEEQLAVAREVAALQRSLQELAQNRQSIAAELAALPLKQASIQSELQKNRSGLKQQLVESNARRSLELRAPLSATVTAITGQTGQFVTPQQPLATLLPSNTPLEVHLYAPSKAIGFIRSGAPVKLRYEAFPYQKFGHAEGVVASISRTPLLPEEIQGMPESQEPLYRIKVKIAKNHVLTYGKPSPLVPGMRLEADITLETRALYEWALEPLYSISGKW